MSSSPRPLRFSRFHFSRTQELGRKRIQATIRHYTQRPRRRLACGSVHFIQRFWNPCGPILDSLHSFDVDDCSGRAKTRGSDELQVIGQERCSGYLSF